MNLFRNRRIYLDWAASAPVRAEARAAFLEALPLYGNPSSAHSEGQTARMALEEARKRIATLLEVKADAVIFTGGATEANAIAIEGHVAALIEKGVSPQDMEVLYLSSAHASTQGAVSRLKERGVSVRPLPLENGAVDITALGNMLSPRTVLIALERVCGETGTRFDTRAIRHVLDTHKSAAVLHVDASQAPLVELCSLTRLGAHTLSLDAQKVGGVRGVGLLVAPRTIPLLPIMRGGGQERDLRPGTEAPHLAASFAAALTTTERERVSFSRNALRMRKTFIADITAAFPDVLVNQGKDGAPHIINLSFCGRDTDYLAALLDAKGIAVSTKSACETGSEGSRAVQALYGDEARSTATIRISFGPSTPESDLTRLMHALIESIRFLDLNAIY